MQWSRLKKQLEDCLCDSLKGRIDFQSTRYRGSHDQQGRAWITFDKEIIYDFCTIRRSFKFNSLANELRKKTNDVNWRDREQADGYRNAYRLAEEILEFEGEYSQYDFYRAAVKYLNLSIEAAMTSDDSIVRALSMFDKRLGKKRLAQMEADVNEKSIVNLFKTIRLNTEGYL
ncbi:hypothetical protein DNH61_02585 [Paenibacillus sambharensis]|uniref:Uncharacterized protein n=1 Tax=Paenibacillus sambharensis TaxID=1803190 RepID=A0A2W1LQZ4_9BACL|nr:hypothetical protein [Paenibacillus sambharensis]PZD97265.1 hypothetical protein DNH61_02585 [Paenibacillus sambharensis]